MRKYVILIAIIMLSFGCARKKVDVITPPPPAPKIEKMAIYDGSTVLVVGKLVDNLGFYIDTSEGPENPTLSNAEILGKSQKLFKHQDKWAEIIGTWYNAAPLDPGMEAAIQADPSLEVELQKNTIHMTWIKEVRDFDEKYGQTYIEIIKDNSPEEEEEEATEESSPDAAGDQGLEALKEEVSDEVSDADNPEATTEKGPDVPEAVVVEDNLLKTEE